MLPMISSGIFAAGGMGNPGHGPRDRARPGTNVVDNRVLPVSDRLYPDGLPLSHLLVAREVTPGSFVFEGIRRNLSLDDDLGPG
jgi:hypothetical protein